MCGICGIAGPVAGGRRDETVRAMNAAIRHRGPDESGFRDFDDCTLAMSRLAIIDLKGGQQPIFNEDRTICVVFNGEIYNFRELRAELTALGHRFSTDADTEVLVHLYEEFGDAMPGKLRGMFAFCINDTKRKRLFFARDPFGEKPFFYYFNGQTLSFSSEVRSLLQNREVPRTLNAEVLHYYLTISYVPEPLTLLKDVYSLPPGHTMVFTGGEPIVRPYFTFDYIPDDSLRTDQDASEFLRPILQQAVARQTVSDVPLGAFLSGGIDSSTVVACLQKESAQKIKTFTVRFEDATYDESPIAREVAHRLGTDHHELVIPNADFDEEIFWRIIDHVGLPFPDSSAIPSYFITHEIRKHVTVALSGDGGDEVFGGYPEFQWWQTIRRIQGYPEPLRRMMLGGARAASRLPGFRSSNLLRKAVRGLTVAQYPENDFGMRIHTMFDDAELARLLNSDSTAPVLSYELLSRFPASAKNWTGLRKAMFYRLTHNLPLDMLVKVDRMSMANSLEVRAPFLDVDLFNASLKLPDHLLVKDGKGKHIIRQLMRKELPNSVFDHPKSGFSIPLHHYQNDSFRQLVNELVNSSSPLMQFFDATEIGRLKRTGLETKSDSANVSVYKSSHRLWKLMMLFGWARRFDVAV